jgi:hypothetical protein
MLKIYWTPDNFDTKAVTSGINPDVIIRKLSPRLAFQTAKFR